MIGLGLSRSHQFPIARTHRMKMSAGIKEIYLFPRGEPVTRSSCGRDTKAPVPGRSRVNLESTRMPLMPGLIPCVWSPSRFLKSDGIHVNGLC
jgi:hypothetical protein